MTSLDKHDEKPIRKYQSCFIMTNNSFQAPKSGIMVMHWLRAAVHMYCLTFQQLEREIDSVMGYLANISAIPIVKKKLILEYTQHMFHAWSIIGKCIDTVHWKLAYQPMGDGANLNIMEWFCKRPWITDHKFVKESLTNTIHPENYPRMRSEPNALSGEMNRFRMSSQASSQEPIEYTQNFANRIHDPEVPYYLSINLLSWMVESLYDTPRSKIYDISVLSTPQRVSNMYATMDPDTNLTCFTMLQELWDPEKYWLMVMLSQTKDISKTSCQRLNISKVCAKTTYHMYGSGGAPSYDNLKNEGTTFASKTLIWAMALHIATKSVKCRKNLQKSNQQYMDLERLLSVDYYYREEGGEQENKLGWRKRMKIASIGHIVIGWATKMLRPLDMESWGCCETPSVESI